MSVRKGEHQKLGTLFRNVHHGRSGVRALRDTQALVAFALTSLLVFPGCGRHQVEMNPGQRAGRVYYLDGAGGGGSPMNWGRGVRDGLIKASVPAEFHQFAWQTRLGVAADQAASVEYKRSKARELASEIALFKREHREQRVNLIALSAGTAVAIFTLEALPSDCMVDNVVLLSSSMSATYDVSDALRHIRHRAFVFTSDRDAVLRLLVPMSGSADRVYCGTDCAGLKGFHPATAALPSSGTQVEKLEQIAWVPEFAKLGHHGGHTDAVNSQFIASRIAPLISGIGVSGPLALAPTSSEGLLMSETSP